MITSIFVPDEHTRISFQKTQDGFELELSGNDCSLTIQLSDPEKTLHLSEVLAEIAYRLITENQNEDVL